MPGAGVEQRRRTGQVRQRRHQLVEPDRLGRCPRHPAGHPQQPVLRGLHHQPRLWMPQQVPVRDGTQPEVLEPQIAGRVHCVVQLARVAGHEGGGVVADQAETVGVPDGLAETGHLLPTDLLVHVGGQQPRRQLRVLRLLADQLRRRLDRQPVQLGRRRPVVQAADGLGRHPQRVHLVQVGDPPLHRFDDLVDVHRLGVAVALADLHHLSTLLLPGLTGCGAFPRRRHVPLLRPVDEIDERAGDATVARRWGGRHPPAGGVGRPARPPTAARGACGALAGLRTRGRARETRSPTGRRFPGLDEPSACDGGRSHSPLRGSPGLTPGSLLPRPLPRGSHFPVETTSPGERRTSCG